MSRKDVKLTDKRLSITVLLQTIELVQRAASDNDASDSCRLHKLVTQCQKESMLRSKYHPTVIHSRIHSPIPQTSKYYRNRFPKT
eukprot:5054716-Amphidinium_carterae.1